MRGDDGPSAGGQLLSPYTFDGGDGAGRNGILNTLVDCRDLGGDIVERSQLFVEGGAFEQRVGFEGVDECF